MPEAWFLNQECITNKSRQQLGVKHSGSIPLSLRDMDPVLRKREKNYHIFFDTIILCTQTFTYRKSLGNWIKILIINSWILGEVQRLHSTVIFRLILGSNQIESCVTKEFIIHFKNSGMQYICYILDFYSIESFLISQSKNCC